MEFRRGLPALGRIVPAGEDCEPVRSYMSHHLGMSLVAIDNVLRDSEMQKRFMKDCDMSALYRHSYNGND